MNKTIPSINIVTLSDYNIGPNPISLSQFIPKSTHKEYIVKALCNQQNLNKLDIASINIDGIIALPAIVSAQGPFIPIISNPV